MPTDAVRVTSGIQWRRTVIRPRQRWLETELYFEVNGRPFSVAFDSVPDGAFLRRVAGAHCLAVYEVPPDNRRGDEANHYRIEIDDGEVVATGSYVRWGPTNPR